MTTEYVLSAAQATYRITVIDCGKACYGIATSESSPKHNMRRRAPGTKLRSAPAELRFAST